MTLHADEYLKQLIARAQSGDAEAVTELYQTHVDRIYRYVAYRVPNTEYEDITADVFTTMVKDLKKFIYTGAPFEAWLYSIARARIADFHRKRRQDVEEIDEQVADQTMQPEERMVQSQEYETIKGELSQLSESEQEVLILRFVERLSHERVAEIMGKSLAAVRTMQHRALTKLAQRLQAKGKEYHYLRGEIPPESETDETD
jgi:RNA polymerase sigma-70 factor, ECF subfamily